MESGKLDEETEVAAAPGFRSVHIDIARIAKPEITDSRPAADYRRSVKLNAFEKAAMNNPVRAFIQRHYEAGLLMKLGGTCPTALALEIGSGRGIGVQIILERFGASHVDAFDLDPEMISIAQERLASIPAERYRMFVGDATKIDSPDGAYDAVFDFGIIHHVPEWRKAIDEVRRVLRKGGRFYFEEVTRDALQRWSARMLTQHPRNDRFSGNDLLKYLEQSGIAVGDRFRYRVGHDFLVGVGLAV